MIKVLSNVILIQLNVTMKSPDVRKKKRTIKCDKKK